MPAVAPFRFTVPRLTCIVVLGCLLGGCRATFVQPSLTPRAVHSRWNHFFLLGAVGHANVDARDLCASGRVTSIETYSTVPTTLLAIFTAGIYTPRRVEVTCDDG